MMGGENTMEVACQRLLEKLSSVKTRQLTSMLVFGWEKTAIAAAVAFQMSSRVSRSKIIPRVN